MIFYEIRKHNNAMKINNIDIYQAPGLLAPGYIIRNHDILQLICRNYLLWFKFKERIYSESFCNSKY